MNGLHLYLAYRLKKYRSKLRCRPSEEKLNLVVLPEEFFIDIYSLDPVESLMLYGFQLEDELSEGFFIGAYLKKPVRVFEFEEILNWLNIQRLTVSIPSRKFAELFPCSIENEVVYEVWVPKIPVSVLESRVKMLTDLIVPRKRYITSFTDMLDAIAKHIDAGSNVKVFVLSKFAEPGYLGRFIELFKESHADIYLAIEDASVPKYLKAMAEKSGNIRIVTSRSHRKLILILFQDEFGDWSVLGYRGSMNLFFPGVDDYMEAVNDVKDLQRLVHGIIRAFLVT